MTDRHQAIALRKHPRQARSRATMEAILDGAAQVLETSSLPAFNTNAVAVRAGVSIGTLYQYFPNKDSLMAALIARNAQQRTEILGNFAAALAGMPLSDVIEQLVGAAIRGETGRPSLAAALDHEERRLPVDTSIEAAGQAMDHTMAALLEPYLVGSTFADRVTACRTMRIAVRAVVDDALNREVPRPDLAHAQCVKLLTGYLA